MSIKTVVLKNGKTFVGQRNAFKDVWIETGSEQRYHILSSKDFVVGEVVRIPNENIAYIFEGSKELGKEVK